MNKEDIARMLSYRKDTYLLAEYLLNLTEHEINSFEGDAEISPFLFFMKLHKHCHSEQRKGYNIILDRLLQKQKIDFDLKTPWGISVYEFIMVNKMGDKLKEYFSNQPLSDFLHDYHQLQSSYEDYEEYTNIWNYKNSVLLVPYINVCLGKTKIGFENLLRSALKLYNYGNFRYDSEKGKVVDTKGTYKKELSQWLSYHNFHNKENLQKAFLDYYSFIMNNIKDIHRESFSEGYFPEDIEDLSDTVPVFKEYWEYAKAEYESMNQEITIKSMKEDLEEQDSSKLSFI